MYLMYKIIYSGICDFIRKLVFALDSAGEDYAIVFREKLMKYAHQTGLKSNRQRNFAISTSIILRPYRRSEKLNYNSFSNF